MSRRLIVHPFPLSSARSTDLKFILSSNLLHPRLVRRRRAGQKALKRAPDPQQDGRMVVPKHHR